MAHYTISFYLDKLYYIPHFEPIIKELIKQGISYSIIIPSTLKRDKIDQQNESIQYCKAHGYIYALEGDSCHCNILIFGNTPRPTSITFSKSALVIHGTWGGKIVYLAPALNNVDLRFVDGQFMLNQLTTHFPEKKDIFRVTGYSKLDSYFELNKDDRIHFLKSRGLDPDKKTILYAPTFYPSSIQHMDNHFPDDFSECNIILKPHSHTFLRKKYRHDLRLINAWANRPNVYMASFKETNIIPFFHAADLLISDISSTVFEFACLNKPVIINQFLSYRFIDKIFPHRLSKRLDTSHFNLWEVGDQPQSYQEMMRLAHDALAHPDKNQTKRKELSRFIVGIVDGQASHRIVEALLELNASIQNSK